MSQQSAANNLHPKAVTSKKIDREADENLIKKEEYSVICGNKSNYYEQMKKMIVAEGWTVQDHASLDLLQEMPNCLNFYIVRKSDDQVLGALCMCVTDHVVYGSSYILRRGFRAGGLGAQLSRTMFYTLRNELKTRALIGRAVPAMWKPYVNRPINAKYFYDVFSIAFKSSQELKEFFPLPQKHNYRIVSIKEIRYHHLFQEIINFDRMVTGQDRKFFLENYFSIDYVNGVALFDENWEPKGMTALSPTGNIEGLYKLNPIYCRTPEEAALLVHTIADMAPHQNAQFVSHFRNRCAGDWIIDRARHLHKKVTMVGALLSSTTMSPVYKDLCRREFVFAPMNSPAHFD